MKMSAYVDEIKLAVTGGLLDLEIPDSTIQQIVNSAMRELQRYICSTTLITIPYEKSLDMKKYNPNSISRVYRAIGAGLSAGGQNDYSDPMQATLFQIASGYGNLYNLNDFTYNYASWNTLQQIRNTISTDLDFFYDDSKQLLYINTNLSQGESVTIEYVPRYSKVEDIKSDFWIDVLMRLSKALTKVTLGRIRSRYTQSNALWTQDGDSMLQEGNTELSELRAYLQQNTNLIYPKD